MPDRPCGEGGAIFSSRGAWCVALGLLGLGLGLAGVGLLVSGRADSTAWAQIPAVPSAGQGILIATAPLGENEVVICLLDTTRERLMVYAADGKRGRLKLLAVRDISADWQLTDWNNDPPLPKEIRARVERATESPRSGGGAETSKPDAGP